MGLKPHATYGEKDAKAPSTSFSTLSIGCNQNCQLHSQKDFIFLSPERAATYQPRATPWVNDSLVFSPERALHKKSDQIKRVTPFQG